MGNGLSKLQQTTLAIMTQLSHIYHYTLLEKMRRVFSK